MTVEAVNDVMVNHPRYEQKKSGGNGKAVASALIPGLGQFMDGRNGAGIGYLAGTTALSSAGALMTQHAASKIFDAESALSRATFNARAGAGIPSGPLDTFFQRVETAKAEAVAESPEVANAKKALQAVEKSMKKYSVLGGLALLASVGLWLYNIIDAYKGKKEA